VYCIVIFGGGIIRDGMEVVVRDGGVDLLGIVMCIYDHCSFAFVHPGN